MPAFHWQRLERIGNIGHVHEPEARPGARSTQFGDFQANAAKLAVSGEVIDPAANLILIEFKQELWAGVISIGKTSAQMEASDFVTKTDK